MILDRFGEPARIRLPRSFAREVHVWQDDGAALAERDDPEDWKRRHVDDIAPFIELPLIRDAGEKAADVLLGHDRWFGQSGAAGGERDEGGIIRADIGE